jgi:hypothetical protein
MDAEPSSRESLLVFACARRQLTDAWRREIAQLAGRGIDWNGVDRFARRHGLLPLVFKHLSDAAPELVPRDRFVSWWAAREEIARRNARMAAELERILAALAAGGIAAIPYKGPTLAMAAFGDLGLREFGDLDLLVPPESVLSARDLLLQAGYRSVLFLGESAERDLVARSRHYEWPLRHESTGALVELHWRADPEYRVVDFARDRSAGVGGTLPPSVLELVLCLHGTKHFWSSAAWLVDVAALAEAETIDWEWIALECRRLGCGRHVALGLRLAADLLRMPVPRAFEEATRERVVEAMASAIAAETQRPFSPARMSLSFRRNLQLRKGVRAKARYAWNAWVAPGVGDWQRWRVPAPAASLYWVLRPIRLLEKYLLRRSPAGATPRTPPPQPRSTG